MFNLFSRPDVHPKGVKGEKVGYITFMLHLAPFDLSGYQVCPKATIGCVAACLNTAGHGGMFKLGTNTNFIQEARKRKTREFFEDRHTFMATLYADILIAIRYAKRRKMIACFRLNATSDVPWEKIKFLNKSMMDHFPDQIFYDYTKVLGRKVPDNYYLLFSRAESNEKDVKRAIKAGMNIAVVFSPWRTHKLPEKWQGHTVIDGDENDLRFLDHSGVVVGLHAKGRARYDKTGFVIQVKKEAA